jgi:hypothetical protein
VDGFESSSPVESTTRSKLGSRVKRLRIVTLCQAFHPLCQLYSMSSSTCNTSATRQSSPYSIMSTCLIHDHNARCSEPKPHIMAPSSVHPRQLYITSTPMLPVIQPITSSSVPCHCLDVEAQRHQLSFRVISYRSQSSIITLSRSPYSIVNDQHHRPPCPPACVLPRRR